MIRLTTKQIQIMDIIVKGNPDGSFVDIDELLVRLPYETTKQSIQFSVRALISKNLIEKQPRELRRGRQRVVLSPTREGYGLIRGAW
jgi:predicted transcriptional regulator